MDTVGIDLYQSEAARGFVVDARAPGTFAGALASALARRAELIGRSDATATSPPAQRATDRQEPPAVRALRDLIARRALG
jgi:hypothetical protein